MTIYLADLIITLIGHYICPIKLQIFQEVYSNNLTIVLK